MEEQIADVRDEEIDINDSLRVIHSSDFYRMGTNQTYWLTPEIELVVTRTYRDSVIVRTVEKMECRGSWSSGWENMSFQIDKVLLARFNPDNRPRRLGEKPEDTDEIQHIDIDHPGIQWLFTDMGRYADQQGYCSQYDLLCARLGIPGRERDFTVKTTLQGIELSTVIKARSQREANEKLHKLLHPESLAIAA